MRDQIPRLVIHIKHPLHKWRYVLAFVLACMIGGALYFGGYKKAGFDHVSNTRMITDLQSLNDNLQDQKVELEARMALFERTRQIDDVANSQLKEQLVNLQQEIQGLREEVAFYRGIVAPSEAKAGIRIQRFEILPLNEERLFHYRLVLTQVSKNDTVASGSVEVVLNGLEAGALKQLRLKDLRTKPTKSLEYRFKYFQNLEGDILLPEGFSPHGVDVAVKPSRGADSIRESFEWPVTRS